MKEYFAIGKVSAMFDISVQTLRHYDKIGLLTPEQVSPSSGYRYYSSKQIRDLEHIIHFRKMGMSLTEICEILPKLKSLDLKIETVLQEQKDKVDGQIKELEKCRTGIEKSLVQCSLPIPETMYIRIMEFEKRVYHCCAGGGASPEDDDYLERSMPLRRELIEGTRPDDVYELGDVCSLAKAVSRSPLTYSRYIVGPVKNNYDSVLVMPQGNYVTMAFRRSEISEANALKRIYDYLDHHRFDYGDDVLLLSRDLLFFGPTGRGDLSEIQIRITM